MEINYGNTKSDHRPLLRSCIKPCTSVSSPNSTRKAPWSEQAETDAFQYVLVELRAKKQVSVSKNYY